MPIAVRADKPLMASPPLPSDLTTSPEQSAPEWYSVHGQLTNVTQYHPPFAASVTGANSLNPRGRDDETTDATLFAGIRVWGPLEFYANPEVDQGYGLNGTFGVAGFPSGEAYKVGSSDPYLRLPRAFFRYTWNLGGKAETIDPGANQLGGTRDDTTSS